MSFTNTHSNEPDIINFCSRVILYCWPSSWYLNLFLQRVFSVLQEPVVCPSHWNRKHDWVKTFWVFSLDSCAFSLLGMSGFILMHLVNKKQRCSEMAGSDCVICTTQVCQIPSIHGGTCGSGSWGSGPQLCSWPTGIGVGWWISPSCLSSGSFLSLPLATFMSACCRLIYLQKKGGLRKWHVLRYHKLIRECYGWLQWLIFCISFHSLSQSWELCLPSEELFC